MAEYYIAELVNYSLGYGEKLCVLVFFDIAVHYLQSIPSTKFITMVDCLVKYISACQKVCLISLFFFLILVICTGSVQYHYDNAGNSRSLAF